MNEDRRSGVDVGGHVLNVGGQVLDVGGQVLIKFGCVFSTAELQGSSRPILTKTDEVMDYSIDNERIVGGWNLKCELWFYEIQLRNVLATWQKCIISNSVRICA